MVHLPALVVAASLLAPAAPAGADARPGPRDKCPVCGMFVARYPEWHASLRLRDGTRLHFDGAKDLLKLWLDPGRYLPSRRREEIVDLSVTDYYRLEPIDARAAFYVAGSDVLGPMGRELVPFGTREAAEVFRRDHHGSAVLGFDQITPELVGSLDA